MPETTHSSAGKAAALILGLCLIISSAVGAYAFIQGKNLENNLQVTGSARKKVQADTVHWTGSFSRSVASTDLKSGYQQMTADSKAVTDFFTGRGINADQITISPVAMEQPYKYDPGAGNGRNDYTLRQTVDVKSTDVQKITDVAKNIQPLIDQGVIFSTYGLEYSYSHLADMRVELLNDAMKDASVRAKNIAESGGRHIGDLRSASMGVVQVLAEGSNDISDYGSYDTSGVNKEVMVTVKAAFSLR